MARTAIELPIFIASPGDASAERAAIETVIHSRARRAAKHGVFLHPVMWEKDARPTLDRPQASINKLLKKCELFVVIFREGIGSAASSTSDETGSEEELRVAMDLVNAGQADDIFLYYRAQITQGATSTPLRAKLEALFASRRIFASAYADDRRLAELFEGHLDLWLDTWEKIRDIVESTLTTSAPATPGPSFRGEDRLVELAAPLAALDAVLVNALSVFALTAYQEHGAAGVQLPLPRGLMPPLFGRERPRLPPNYAALREMKLCSIATFPVCLDADGDLRFSDDAWFHLFCAKGLVSAILDEDWASIERKPYINAIHQLLSVLAQQQRPSIVARLVAWLSDRKSPAATRPVVRNFAAYVLGMLEAREAEDALALALEDKGQQVAFYAVTALGKIRSRRHLDSLAEMYAREADGTQRLMIGMAICRIIGVAEYAM